jgi:hypothetical protein
MKEPDKFDIILGQPWLQAVNPDIDWSTKTIRDRKAGEAMVFGDEYTVHMAVHHLRMRWQSCLGNNQQTSS